MCLGDTVCLCCVDMTDSDVFGVNVSFYCVDIMRNCDVFGGYCLVVLC